MSLYGGLMLRKWQQDTFIIQVNSPLIAENPISFYFIKSNLSEMWKLDQESLQRNDYIREKNLVV